MKYFLLIISFSIIFHSNAQVLIDADGTATLENSAMLDVQSTEKGFLPPRVSWAEMQAIASPAEGLMIYNTTANCMYMYNGDRWYVIEYCNCGSVSDYEGNYYETVQIGNQCWMAENLRSSKYADGTNISGDYYKDADYLENYGRVYTWAAIMHGAGTSNANPSGVQGVCPDGWHVPSDAEWLELENQICEDLGHTNCASIFNGTNTGWLGHIASQGKSEGKAMKEYNSLWNGNASNVNAGYNNSTDPSGFNALPAANRHPTSGFTFSTIGSTAFFWSTTEGSPTNYAYYRSLYYDERKINRNIMEKTYGLSVRCIRD